MASSLGLRARRPVWRAWSAVGRVRGLSDEAASPLVAPITEPAEPAAVRALPRPGEVGPLRSAPDAEVCGHLIAYRDVDGLRRVGVLRERRGREAWLADHPEGLSIVHSTDVDSFWRLRKPLRASSVQLVRREVGAILERVRSYAEVVERNTESAWAALVLPEGSIERAEDRNCRDLVQPLFGGGGSAPTNLQLLAVHKQLSTDPNALAHFKSFARGLSFTARSAEAVKRTRATLERNSRFVLSGDERVRMLLRLRQCARHRDAQTAPALRQAESERKAAIAAARKQAGQALAQAAGQEGTDAMAAPPAAAAAAAEASPAAAAAAGSAAGGVEPASEQSVALRECLQCPAAKLPLFLPSMRLVSAASVQAGTAAALGEALAAAKAAKAASAARAGNGGGGGGGKGAAGAGPTKNTAATASATPGGGATSQPPAADGAFAASAAQRARADEEGGSHGAEEEQAEEATAAAAGDEAEAEAAAVAPFGACATEERVLLELQRFALADEHDEGYVCHEQLVSLLLWPLTRRDRPFGALELLVRLGKVAPFANTHVLRATSHAAAARAEAELAAAQAGAGLLDPLPPWAEAEEGWAEAEQMAAPPGAPAAAGGEAGLQPAAGARLPVVSCALAPQPFGAVLTIDGEDAEEIDDGLSAQRAPEGGVWVHVHIANPTTRIRAGSPLDELAAQRAKTVYLPEGSVPMLPASLARGPSGTGLEPTSPGHGPPRSALTFSARVDDSTGALLEMRAQESELPTVLALTYRSADLLLAAHTERASCAGADASGGGGLGGGGLDGGAAEDGVLGSLLLLEQVARARRARRMSAGALSLCLPRPNPRVCVPSGRVRVQSSVWAVGARSAALVEEMMILGGEVCAELALVHGVPVAFRAQALPAERSDEHERALAQLRALCTEAAVEALRGGAESADRLLRAGAGPALARLPSEERVGMVVGGTEQMVLSVGVLPLLRPATTSLAPAGGHASLGLRAYAQVTSPLRRSLDLVAHHQLRALLASAGGGQLSAVPLDEAGFALASDKLAALDAALEKGSDGAGLGAEAAQAAGALGLPFAPAAVHARAAHVSARSLLIDRLEMASSRYWTLQFLAQRARDGQSEYDAVALANEPAGAEAGKGKAAGDKGGSVMVLLPELGLRAWLRDCELPAGEKVRVRVQKVHAHRGVLGLQLAPPLAAPSTAAKPRDRVAAPAPAAAPNAVEEPGRAAVSMI